MATHPTYVDHHHIESDSSVFFKVATLLLGIAVGIVGFFALMMWADARDSRTDASAAPAARPAAVDHSQAGAMPLNSFAGVVPPNAQALAEAHKAYDAALPAAQAGPVAHVHLTLKDMTPDRTGRQVQHLVVRRPRRPRTDPARPPGPAREDDADERRHDP